MNRTIPRIPAVAAAVAAVLILGAVAAAAHPAMNLRTTLAQDDRPTHILAVQVAEPARTDRPSTSWQPAADAKVTVYEFDRDKSRTEPAAQGRTNADGWVRFQLPAGHYGVLSFKDDRAGHERVHLDDDQRIRIQLDRHRSQDRPDRGHYGLGAIVAERTADGIEPVENATVIVEQVRRDATTANTTLHVIARGQTDERGTYATALPAGYYRVTVEHDGKEQVRKVHLNEDTWLRYLFTDKDRPDHDAPHRATPRAHPAPATNVAAQPSLVSG